MTCKIDLVSIGFKIFEASKEPSAEPAPIITCISSINKIIFLFLLASFVTFLSLSSKSPLYFEPAIRAEISKVKITLFFITSGTFPATISAASPSAMAVLPTPGSPIKTGLFLVLLDKT